MATEVIMPKLGLTMTEGKIIDWLKQEGDPVKQGEALFVVETDKVTLDVEALISGTLLKIVVGSGQTTPLSQVIAYIGKPGEELPDFEDISMSEAFSPSVQPTETMKKLIPTGDKLVSPIKTSPLARRMAKEHDIDLSTVQGTGPQGRIVKADIQQIIEDKKIEGAAVSSGFIKASPIAKRIAREYHIDLSSIQGTGPQGRIVEADIQKVIDAQKADKVVAPIAEGIPSELRSINTVKRLTAQRMSESFQTAPHFYLHIELNVVRLVKLRKKMLPEFEAKLGIRLTYTDFLLKALAQSLPGYPLLNASWSDGKVRIFKEVNLGVAMATERGLVVGVIHQAEKMGLKEIAQARDNLKKKATANRLKHEDMAGGTFTITNLGMFGIDDFSPILNPPQSAILAVGAIVERPVGEEGKVVLRPTLRLTLAVDHRAADGVEGALFLKAIRETLVSPEALLK